jgi:hypothetical protein
MSDIPALVMTADYIRGEHARFALLPGGQYLSGLVMAPAALIHGQVLPPGVGTVHQVGERELR